MKEGDAKKMRELFPIWAGQTKDVKSICVHSPDGLEHGILSPLFPEAEFTFLKEKGWNLMDPAPRKFDLFVANNVFMYSPDPQRWFDNVMKSCRYVWIQDIVRGRRDRDGELGNDGDSMRYQLFPDGVARLPGAFDLSRLGSAIKEFKPYSSAPADAQNDSLHFYLFLESQKVIGSKDDQRDPPVSTRKAKKSGSTGDPI